ncbi:hypothetical protein L3Y34_014078 [Caenorhabditis briggsae]|uniref:Uncharacterized protein n=1 Tax=Caenorhabditis briggsae TaxID=6238 RepID=A0AAE9IX09_CAEBR|nr:hypothetical protein L3Y34_014078 [Caenorhabditis briggsae]
MFFIVCVHVISYQLLLVLCKTSNLKYKVLNKGLEFFRKSEKIETLEVLRLFWGPFSSLEIPKKPIYNGNNEIL